MQFLSYLNSILWGPPLIIFLMGTGLYFTFKLNFIQIFSLPRALRYLFSRSSDSSSEEGEISGFAALCTSLSATVGTGNIVGVATAIKLGGPGALFWMFVAGLIGMATKYAECLLAVKFRRKNAEGQYEGSPMIYMELGMNKPFLAKLFALFTLGVALLGIGTFPQSNAIIETVGSLVSLPKELCVAILLFLVASSTIGGIQSISKIASRVVPFMILLYFFSCVYVLVLNAGKIPSILLKIVSEAFTGSAPLAGFAGASFLLALQAGVSRGVFSNESGLGSAPMAAALGKTNSCVKQGLISMTGTFFDTIIICSLTGLTLLVTDVWSSPVEGALAMSKAFSVGLGNEALGPLVVSFGLVFFAFTTILGWNFYGEVAVKYLLGKRFILPYKIVFVGLVGLGAFMKLDSIWTLANIVNALMILPNLAALVSLRKIVLQESRHYFQSKRTKVNKRV